MNEERRMRKDRSSISISFNLSCNRCWQDHTSQLIMIRSIFLYLDRTFVLQTPGLPAIWDMGLALFRSFLSPPIFYSVKLFNINPFCNSIDMDCRKQIVSHPEIKGKLIEGILSLINSERKGEDSSRSLLKKSEFLPFLPLPPFSSHQTHLESSISSL